MKLIDQRMRTSRATEHDWRKCEARLKRAPQFTTEIDGLAIRFIQVKSRHENYALETGAREMWRRVRSGLVSPGAIRC